MHDARPRYDLLVVDDHSISAKLLRLTLVARGHQVRVAPDAERALGALAAAVPHVLLTDVQLPGMCGLSLVRLLRASPATAALPIVVVSALASREDEEAAIAEGADAFMAKPIDTRAVVTLVETLAALSLDRVSASRRAH